jgi:hypothetical protein
MLDNATIDGLKALRLHAMAAALAEQNEQAGYTGLSFGERLGLLIDRELAGRASRRIQRSLKTARLRCGTRPSPTPQSPTLPSTGSCTTPSRSSCPANPCAAPSPPRPNTSRSRNDPRPGPGRPGIPVA